MRRIRVELLDVCMRKSYHEELGQPRVRRHDSSTFPMTGVMGIDLCIHGLKQQVVTGFTLLF